MSADLVALLARVRRSSNRMRVAMAITAALCLLIATGIASDGSVWRGGWGWRVAGLAGTTFFVGLAALLVYGTFLRQHRHSARLRSLLREDPDRIRSIAVSVARAAPYASWEPDDGVATRGLHVVISDDSGATWVLPVSRADVDQLVSGLARRCPRAVVTPPR